MRIGLNFDVSNEGAVNISLNETRITAKDLLELMQLDHVNTCRFLKIPKTEKDKLQTININPDNVDCTLEKLGFQDNTSYTFISLI